MKVFDKAAWHIDGGENEVDVVARFREVFKFLEEKNMLTVEGKETLEYVMDNSVSLNSNMVTVDGNNFLEHCYDELFVYDPQRIRQTLHEAYRKYVDEI